MSMNLDPIILNYDDPDQVEIHEQAARNCSYNHYHSVPNMESPLPGQEGIIIPPGAAALTIEDPDGNMQSVDMVVWDESTVPPNPVEEGSTAWNNLSVEDQAKHKIHTLPSGNMYNWFSEVVRNERGELMSIDSWGLFESKGREEQGNAILRPLFPPKIRQENERRQAT